MTERSFTLWVNDDLLSNSTLECGAPRKLSVEVGRKWLHSVGSSVHNQRIKRLLKAVFSVSVFQGVLSPPIVQMSPPLLGV